MAEQRQQYTGEFKEEAVRLITEQGYKATEAARNLGINFQMLRRWKREVAEDASQRCPGNSRLRLGQDERHQLREDNKRRRMERDI